MTEESQTNTEATEDATDWKAIAMQLARRVNFAVTNLKGNGGGMLDLNTGKVIGWREYMAEGLEMIPGIEVDREILATLELPPQKRKKAQAEIKAKRATKSTNDD